MQDPRTARFHPGVSGGSDDDAWVLSRVEVIFFFSPLVPEVNPVLRFQTSVDHLTAPSPSTHPPAQALLIIDASLGIGSLSWAALAFSLFSREHEY